MVTVQATESHSSLSTESDEALFERFAKDGHRAAFEELLHRHLNGFYRFALLICRNSALAEEATQEAVLALATQAHKFSAQRGVSGNSEHAFRNWGYAVVRNCTRHSVRRETSRQARDVKAGQEQAVYIRSLSPEQEQDSKVMCEALNGALGGLEEKIRLAVSMHYLDGLTCDAIGEISGVSAQMIHKRIKKGLELLRARLVQSGHTLSATALIGMLQEAEAVTVPAGMAERLVNQAITAVSESSPVDDVTGLTGTGVRALVAVSIFIIFGSVGFLYYPGSDSAKMDRSKAQSADKALDADRAEALSSDPMALDRKSIDKLWRFDNQQLDGLTFTFGKWHWGELKTDVGNTCVALRHTADDVSFFGYGSPVVFTPGDLFITPPLQVTFDVYATNPKSNFLPVCAYWSERAGRPLPMKELLELSNYDSMDEITHSEVIDAPSKMKSINGKRWGARKLVITHKEVLSVVQGRILFKARMLRPWQGPRDKLFLLWAIIKDGALLDNLHIQTIDWEKVPGSAERPQVQAR